MRDAASTVGFQDEGKLDWNSWHVDLWPVEGSRTATVRRETSRDSTVAPFRKHTISFPFFLMCNCTRAHMCIWTHVSVHTVDARRGSVLSCGSLGHGPAGSGWGRSHSRAHNATPAPTVASTATAPHYWWGERGDRERSMRGGFLKASFYLSFIFKLLVGL